MIVRHRRRSGFALLIVIWSLVVIGVVVLEVQRTARLDRMAAINARDAVRSKWSARAGAAQLTEELDQLLGTDSATTILLAAGDTVLDPLLSTSDGIHTSAVVVDCRSRLNLNSTGRRELRALVVATGAAAGREDQAVAAVLRWRSHAAVHDIAGNPGDRVQSRVYSLHEFRGPDPSLEHAFSDIAPYVTTCGDGLINVNSAPLPVLATVPGLDESGAAVLIHQRARAPFRNVMDVVAALPRGHRPATQDAMAGLAGRLAFRARDVEVIVVASATTSLVGFELRSTHHLSGRRRWQRGFTEQIIAAGAR